MKETLSEYLHFTRAERRGIFFLCLLITLFLALPYMYSFFLPDKALEDGTEGFEADIQAWQAGLYDQDSIRQAKYEAQRQARYAKWDKEKKGGAGRYPKNEAKWKKDGGKDEKSVPVTIKGQPFNPNEASREEWLAMGLPEKTVGTLLNYRDKGGRFYKKEDLKKIYGFKPEWYDELEPFIQIPAKAGKPYAKKRNDDDDSSPIAGAIPDSYELDGPTLKDKQEEKEYSPREKIVADVNVASEEELQKVYGIGPYYAKRIVKFRESLGGYAHLGQVAEIYGMPDSVYQKIRPGLKLEHPEVRQININTATADELKNHPYISWKVANAIVKYRENHGPYAQVSALEGNYAIPSELLEKLKPYLSVE